MKKIMIFGMWATPPGVPRRTPLARGEFCSRLVATYVPLWLEGCPQGRGVAIIKNQTKKEQQR